MRSDVYEILLLPFHFDCLLHLALLQTLGPLLLTYIGDAAEYTLEGPIVVLLWVCTEEYPGIASYSISIQPRSLEAKFHIRRLSLVYQIMPCLSD